MRNFRELGKKLLSLTLTLSMTAGLCAGINFANKSNAVEVNAATTGFTQNDFLKVDGTYIKNNYGKGNNVYLRGTNIGNLFVQESWMSSTDATDQKTILENLTNRFGQDKALELLDYYESNYFTEADLDNCKKMGMSVIRVPFTYMNLYKKSGDSWVLRSDAFTRLDWIVEQCSQRGIYVILDLHGAFGSQNGQDHSGQVIDSAANVTFFSNETLMSQTLDMWRIIAQHYNGNPAVAGYDTLNEPGEKAGSTGSKHWAFYDRMYDTIRSVDPDHIIIMESCWGTANLPNPSTYGWTNVVYEYHHYPWSYVSDTEANLQGQKTAIDNLVNSVNSANYGVPTYIGEFNCFDGDAKWQYVLEKMNNAGWHYTNWSYKSRGMGSWGIYHEYASQSKASPASSSESEIRTRWSASAIGTNNSDTGVTYNNMKAKLPGTVVFADTALTDANYFAIKAGINSKYVCADKYGEANLLADRDAFGEWEQFRVINNSDGTISFQSRANNKYLCTIFDDTDTENPIKARSNQISTWEKFYLEENSDGTYSLKTYVNNKYVQADINDSTAGILHATSDTIGTWEKFTFVPVSSESSLPGATEPTTTAVQTTANQTTAASSETTVTCPGSFEIDSYSSKSSEITITTNDGVKLAGQLVNGSYLEYKVNVATAGKYDLNLSLATTGTGRILTITVDGTSVGTISPAAASGWFDFVSYKTTINFSAGTHTLRISTTGSCNIANPSFTEWEEEVSVTIPSTSSNTKYGNNYKVVAYYPNWYGDYTSKVQWDKITHAYYAFGLPNSDGSGSIYSLDSSSVTPMINACNNNNVVPVLSVGGWSHSNGQLCSEVFAANTNTDAKCLSLAQSIVNAAKQYGFKGVDIDWEYPNSSTQSQYTKFMKNLRTLCDENDMILTVAVAAKSGSGFTSEVLNLLDFVNIMAYDGDSGSGHSPYSLATQSFTYWRDTMNVPANKLVIGVPFYERPNWASYADIVSVNSAYAQQDSAVINGTTVYYNGIPTMKQKAEYAANNAGGIMIWEISQDATSQSLSLLTAIYDTTIGIVGEGGTTQATVSDVPGTIKVDSYGDKTSGITINTSGDTTYAGNLTNSAYLDYYIKVASKGTYDITLNLAAGDAQYNADNILVKLNDSTVATVPIVASSSWTTFVAHTATITFAAKGTYKLTLVSDGGACNVTDFSLTKKVEETTTATPQTTTQVQTTQAQTTTAVSGTAPLEVIGLVTSCIADNKINVVWGQDDDRLNLGQTYNVYIDGTKVMANVPCASYDIDNIAAGTKTIKVTAELNGVESTGLTAVVTVTGSSVVTTKAPETTTEEITTQEVTTVEEPTTGTTVSDESLQVLGYQISATAKGFRTVYSVEPQINGQDVVSRGIVYSLSSKAEADEIYVGSTNSYVFSYEATSAGKLPATNLAPTSTASCYAMTMKFGGNSAEFTTEYRIKVFAKLADGSYVYSVPETYTIYNIADKLYQQNNMPNYASHNYLYTDILKVITPDYEEVDYDFTNTLYVS